MFWLLSPLLPLAFVIVAICRRDSVHSGRWQVPLFLAGWLFLLMAGLFCRDILLIIFTAPFLVFGFAVCAVLWRSVISPSSRSVNLLYWAGCLAILAGAFFCGLLAREIQAIDSHYYADLHSYPLRPHVARELIAWSIPSWVTGFALMRSRRLRRTSVAIITALLLLLNPTILWMVAWLKPSLGM